MGLQEEELRAPGHQGTGMLWTSAQGPSQTFQTGQAQRGWGGQREGEEGLCHVLPPNLLFRTWRPHDRGGSTCVFHMLTPIHPNFGQSAPCP